jgi:hypothetical protein
MAKTNDVARTPGAKRPGAGECLFELAKVSPLEALTIHPPLARA